MSLKIKRGDTVELQCQYTNSEGLPIPLTGYTIKSQIRDNFDNFIDEFLVTVTDELNGIYLLRISDTSAFPVKELFFDVQYSYEQTTISTGTQSIIVSKDITR
jgi:hypothetical protein